MTKFKSCSTDEQTISELLTEFSQIEKLSHKICGIGFNNLRVFMVDKITRMSNPIPKLKGLLYLLKHKRKYEITVGDFTENLYINHKVVSWDELEKYA